VSRAAVILRNVASNWAGFVLNAGVTLLLTPYVLHSLGTARYGIWILTSSIIGYYGLLDVGFRSGVTQYLTRYLAVGDNERASACMSSAVAALGALGLTLFGVSVGAAYAAPHLFDLPADLAGEAFWCIVVVGCSVAIQLALAPFTSVFTATQRFDLANAIGAATRLLTAVLIVGTLSLSYGLIGLSVATCAASIVDYVVRWRVARHLAPGVIIARKHASAASLREIGAFGAWSFLISINVFVYQHVPNLLIAAVMPIAAVGHYALAMGLARQIHSILTPVGQVIYPAAAQIHAQGDRGTLERLYHDGSRLLLLAMISLVMLACFWAGDFYRLWIGEKYLSGVPFHSVALLFQILLISVVTTYVSSIAGQVLTGAGKVNLVALALLAGSAINVTSMFVLVRFFGLAGVAAAMVLGSFVVDVVAIPLLLQHSLGLTVSRFVVRACLRPLAVGALEAAAFWTIRQAGTAGSWPQLMLQGALACGAASCCVLAVGMTRGERERFVFRPVRRLRGTEKKNAETVGAGLKTAVR
jgi:O-antigen/teichoic acid export membrane protein